MTEVMMTFNFSIWQPIKLLSIITLVWFPSANIAAGSSQNELKLHAEQWETTRNGEYMLQIPVLNKVVNEWLLKEGYSIELRYPGGEEGELWVGELMDWLISLGIPSKYLIAVPGSGKADIVIFKLIKAEEKYR